MKTVEPRKPGGFGEYLPNEQIEFNRLLDIIRHTYERYGFAPLDTPDLELTEVLLAKGGGETEQEVYSFAREGSRTNLTMRYDLTVPLARYVAEHESDLVFPFRRYHIGKVHRAERQQAGRFREFYQCDIDVIGSDSPIVDAEFPAVINEIFEAFNFGEFVIHLNNRQVLNGFFESIGLVDSARDVLHVIDKMAKITHDELLASLKKVGLTDEQVKKVLAFTSISGTSDEVFAQIAALSVDSEQFNAGVEKLKTIVLAIKAMGVPEHRFMIDLKIARGLDYYTGTVYETFLSDYPQIGSVCSGGRYDDLASYYTKTRLPGVGISIGLTRLFYALRQAGAINATQQSPAHTIVVPIDTPQSEYAIQVADSLRGAGVETVLYSEPDDMGKKLRYASRMGFRHAVIIGEAEQSAGTVSLKDLAARQDQQVTPDEAVRILSADKKDTN